LAEKTGLKEGPVRSAKEGSMGGERAKTITSKQNDGSGE